MKKTMMWLLISVYSLHTFIYAGTLYTLRTSNTIRKIINIFTVCVMKNFVRERVLRKDTRKTDDEGRLSEKKLII